MEESSIRVLEWSSVRKTQLVIAGVEDGRVHMTENVGSPHSWKSQEMEFPLEPPERSIILLTALF